MSNIDNLTVKDIRELLDKLQRESNQFGEVRATLIVNCMPGRPLHKLGLEYDKSKSVLANMLYILEQLVHRIGEQNGP